MGSKVWLNLAEIVRVGWGSRGENFNFFDAKGRQAQFPSQINENLASQSGIFYLILIKEKLGSELLVKGG